MSFRPGQLVSRRGQNDKFEVKYESPNGQMIGVADEKGNLTTLPADDLVLLADEIRDENTDINEIVHPVNPAKEYTMTEKIENTVPVEEDIDPTEEPQTTRLQAFVNKHPRAAKVVAVTGGAIAVLGTAHFARTLKSNKEHLQQAGDHLNGAVTELSNAASPTDD